MERHTTHFGFMGINMSIGTESHRYRCHIHSFIHMYVVYLVCGHVAILVVLVPCIRARTCKIMTHAITKKIDICYLHKMFVFALKFQCETFASTALAESAVKFKSKRSEKLRQAHTYGTSKQISNFPP